MQSTKNTNKRQQQAEMRKQAILLAAFSQFTKNGFAMTRIEDIAKQANVSKGSIYNHFASKEALLEALVKEHILSLLPEKLPPLDSEKDLSAFVLTTFTRILKNVFYGDPGRLLQLVISEGERFPKVAEMYYKTVISLAMQKIKTILETAEQKNLLVNPALKEFPQLLAAPMIHAMIWTRVFEKFQKVDFEKMLKLHLATVFHTPPKEAGNNDK